MNFLGVLYVVIHVYLNLRNIANAQDCGTVQVCVQPHWGGQHRIFLTLSLNSALPGNLNSVAVGGYAYHFVSEAVSTMSTPGRGSNLIASSKTYTDFWDISLGTGNVQIGFPFVRGYGDGNSFCYGNFRHVFAISSSGSTICASALLLRSQKVDFALVVDTTGSMSDDIAAVKADVIGIVNTLSSVSTSFRGAVVEYNDRSTVNDASIIQTLTSSTPAVLSAINGLKATGGGDYAECLYDGLALALALPWDLTARRITVTMGDAPGKVCDSGTTLEDVLSLTSFVDIDIDISPAIPVRLKSNHRSRAISKTVSVKLSVKNLTPLYMVAVGREPSGFKSLAEKTGGTVITALAATDVVDAIEEAIRDGPVAPKSTKDLSIVLSCGDSTSEWHVFGITNPNYFPVPFEFQNLFARIQQNGTASPGETTIRTKAVPQIYITFKWTKTETGEIGSVVYTPKPCS